MIVDKVMRINFKLYCGIVVFLGLVSVHVLAQQIINTQIINETPDNRYTIHKDNTITDTQTGLMWQRCSVGQSGDDCSIGGATYHNWLGALQLAVNDTTAGYTDWRLPNIKELFSIIAHDRVNPSINLAIFPNTVNTRYWSSSPAAGKSSSAWEVRFDGGGHYLNNATTSYSRVRLVRDGE